MYTKLISILFLSFLTLITYPASSLMAQAADEEYYEEGEYIEGDDVEYADEEYYEEGDNVEYAEEGEYYEEGDNVEYAEEGEYYEEGDNAEYAEDDGTEYADEEYYEEELSEEDAPDPVAESLARDQALETRIEAVESYMQVLQTYLQNKEQTEIANKEERQQSEKMLKESQQKKIDQRNFLDDGKPKFLDMMVRGNMNSYYKIQTDYHTPLDSPVAIQRHGANNRSKQRSRMRGEMAFIALGDKQHSHGTDWYKWIGVWAWAIDANDPDHPDTEDGDRRGRFMNKDMWVRYSPHIALGIKLGTQTIAGTANPANNYIFEGDHDHDFILYGASTLLEAPGLSFDIHLHKTFQIGFGVFEGMGDGSAIASGGANASEASTTAFWSILKTKWIKSRVGYQSIKVGGEVEQIDPDITHFGQEFKHTVLNFTARLDLFEERYSLYYALQQLKGDKAEVPFANEDLMTLSELLDLEIEEESRTMSLSTQSFGAIIDLDKFGAAVDYSQIKTPPFNEEGGVYAAVGIKSVFQSNIYYKFDSATKIYGFYHAINSKIDEARDIAEQNARDNEATMNDFGELPDVDVEDLGEKVIEAVESLEWTGTKSFGVGFRIDFGF